MVGNWHFSSWHPLWKVAIKLTTAPYELHQLF